MYFTFNWFPPQENKREREIARAPIAHPSIDESHPSTGEIVAPQRRLDRHHPRSIHPKPISFSTAIILDHWSISLSLDRQIWWIFFCWVLFLLCLSIEKLYYIFIWKLRKCEQQVKNVFSIIISRIQPNIRKYFLKHFLKYNKTLENILHPENILH